MTMIAYKHYNCTKMVSCKVTTIENQMENRWHKEALRAPWGVGGIRGSLGGVGVSGVYWGPSRECRYSGARRGIGGIRGYWGS